MTVMLAALLQAQYGLELQDARRAPEGAGSDTWFLRCAQGAFVLKFPSGGAIDHPEAEPALCEFLRAHGVPACEFLKNRAGSCLSYDQSGRVFTVQRRLPGRTPAWHSAPEALLLESAALLGRIHRVLLDYSALPAGIGADFFAHMTPQRALASYRRSLETAMRLGDRQSAAELRWRIGLMARFPGWQFDVRCLTLRNTHGDYCVSQFLCEGGRLRAVIDWTAACVHPVVWELMRSFVYGAPCCADGHIDRPLLDRYVNAYCREGTLNDHDLEVLERLYLYQIAVCDYYGQYYASDAKNRAIFLRQARFATRLLQAQLPG